MPILARTNTSEHVCADSRIMYICADRYTTKEGDNMKSERVAHGIYAD